MSLLTLLLLVALCDGAPSFTFPDRFSARVGGWVRDAFVDDRVAYSTGFQHTDYTLGYQRTDEIWDVTSINGTTLWNSGIRSDTHLFLGSGPTDAAFMWYQGATTGAPVCLKTPTGLLAKDAFASPSSYVGSGIVNGVPVDVFNGTLAFVFNVTLWVSRADKSPVQLFVGPNPQFGGWKGSFVQYSDFKTRR